MKRVLRGLVVSTLVAGAPLMIACGGGHKNADSPDALDNDGAMEEAGEAVDDAADDAEDAADEAAENTEDAIDDATE